MIMMIISFFVVVLSFNLFMMSYQVNGVNRLVLGAPMSLFETAIDMVNIDESEGPKFNHEILADNLTSYFDYSMPQYTDDYSLNFYYYNPTNHSVCLKPQCKAVEVTVNASLALGYQYSKTMYYEIRSN